MNFAQKCMNQPAPRQKEPLPLTLLRLVLALQCIGLLAAYYLVSFEIESNVYELLYFDWHYPEAVAQGVDDGGVLLAGFCGIMLVVFGWLRFAAVASPPPSERALRRQLRLAGWLERTAACWLFVWFLAIAAAHQIRGGPYAQLALGEHAVRFLAPVAFWLCIPSAKAETFPGRWNRHAEPILRLAAAATFAVHGYKAIQGYGPFLDLILLSDLRWSTGAVSEQLATVCLQVIGWVDLVVAAVILTRWWPAAALYMTAWGLITAASRMTALGADYWPATILRAANGGVPLVLLASWWCRTRVTPRCVDVSSDSSDVHAS
jgi:hypothetical protein